MADEDLNIPSADAAGAAALSQKRAFKISSKVSSGPIPSPDILAEYEAVLKGSAERIIKMAELEQLHRHGLQNTAIMAASTDACSARSEARTGQIFAIIIAIVAMITCFLFIYTVPSAPGATVASIHGGTTVCGIVTTFLVGSRKPQQPVSEKAIGNVQRSGPDQ